MTPIEPLDLDSVTLSGGSVTEPESDLANSVMKGITRSHRSKVLVQPLTDSSLKQGRNGGCNRTTKNQTINYHRDEGQKT